MNWSDLGSDLHGLLDELKETIKAGLNAGNGDGEWEALVTAGDLLGLEYDEEEDKYA